MSAVSSSQVKDFMATMYFGPVASMYLLGTCVFLTKLKLKDCCIGFGSLREWPDFSNLRLLSLDNIRDMTFNHQALFIRKYPNLELLSRKATGWDLDILERESPGRLLFPTKRTTFPRLRDVVLRCPRLGEQDMVTVQAYCPMLATLRLEGDEVVFTAGRLEARHILGVAEDGDQQRFRPQKWGCLSLIFFHAYICGLESKPQARYRAVFEQLARLANLNTLEIGAPNYLPSFELSHDGPQLKVGSDLFDTLE
ncbi:hypothetical protein BC939DRAFT_498598 [Gamsiella multidivaricata]|uniref:uncharacterized protein n=1 Tax=Gamsiella multidivaricata TaxID=101098 RepID=UPI00222123BA|nr:uncharacterized protein BC939DRAFT_498598 [Gamsiella multidivaricata]KAI7831615.1 hypothetical protein BC939DRAFT_498598 [Gamsiella multidivaricata]